MEDFFKDTINVFSIYDQKEPSVQLVMEGLCKDNTVARVRTSYCELFLLGQFAFLGNDHV